MSRVPELPEKKLLAENGLRDNIFEVVMILKDHQLAAVSQSRHGELVA